MMLALRTSAASDATFVQRSFCWLIKARLVSMYCHGGIVINGDLYHITGSHGWGKVPAGQWSPEKWVLIDVPGADDAYALSLFESVTKPPQGRFARWVWRLLKGYDWFGLIAFTGVKTEVDWLDYCFEWCWLAITGTRARERITPEMLLAKCVA